MSPRYRLRALKILESSPFNTVIIIAVMVSVFAWDITRGWLPPAADLATEGLMAACFLLFTAELVLMVLARRQWYKSVLFWVYFLATVTMIFDMPSLMGHMMGIPVLMQTTKNLRLIKILRVMSRLGRLIRILKNFALGWFKLAVNRIFNRHFDTASKIQIKKIREKIAESDNSSAWSKLEIAITTGILTAFFLVFLPATLYLDREIGIMEEERSFRGLDGANTAFFLTNYPSVYRLEWEGHILADDPALESTLRYSEIREFKTSRGTIRIDTGKRHRSNARMMTWINLLMVFFSSTLTIFIDWIISRYSLEISGTLKTLAKALDERDSYTRMHSRHVAAYAVETARHLGLGRRDLDVIQLAGELHDIGKIGVPEAILHKDGKLDDDEYTVMKRHTEQGARILNPLINLDQVILAVFHHHEKFDGSGYPEGLKGDDIPLVARILSVCDVWDALTTDRPYRKALDRDIAEGIIREKTGSDFCPRSVDAFFASEAWRRG
jgi:putative nucleotidyltransferase with HDIG domain